MFAGTGFTICASCGLVVPVIGGFCELCGETFPKETIANHVVELEAAA